MQRILLLVAVAAGLLLSAAPARALEGDVSPYGLAYSNSGSYAKSDPAVGTKSADRGLRGLFVMGDSKSNQVPYITENAGIPTEVRQSTGWTVRYHEEFTGWPDGQTSLQSALASNAQTVFVELGTNDIAGLRNSADTPAWPSDAYNQWAFNQRIAIALYVQDMARKLVEGGKCVVWAGPREFDRGGPQHANITSTADDAAFFNGQLKALADKYGPSRFRYLPLTDYESNPGVMKDDLDRPGGDGVHLSTAAAKKQLADVALYWAHYGCGMS